jgi:hypothetical protein
MRYSYTPQQQYTPPSGMGQSFPTAQEAGLASPKALGAFGLIITGFVVAFGLSHFLGKDK